MKEIILLLGGNIGPVLTNMYKARQAIQQQIGRIISLSSIHTSDPYGFDSVHVFYNQAVLLQSTYLAEELLKRCQKIEQGLGRRQKSLNGVYEDRTMDIDILYYENQQINLPHLIIPHPKIKEREFVINPLKEIQFAAQNIIFTEFSK